MSVYRHQHTSPLDATNTILSMDDRFRVERVDGGDYEITLQDARWRVDAPELCVLADAWLVQRQTQSDWLPIVIVTPRPVVGGMGRDRVRWVVLVLIVLLLLIGVAVLVQHRAVLGNGPLVGVMSGACIVGARWKDR